MLAVPASISFAIARRVSVRRVSISCLQTCGQNPIPIGWEDKSLPPQRLLRQRCSGRLYARAFGDRSPEIAQGAFEIMQVGQDVARPDGAHGADTDDLVAQLGTLASDHGAVAAIHVPDDRRAIEPLWDEPDRDRAGKRPADREQ